MHHKESGEKAIPECSNLAIFAVSHFIYSPPAIESFGSQDSLLLHAFIPPAYP